MRVDDTFPRIADRRARGVIASSCTRLGCSMAWARSPKSRATASARAWPGRGCRRAVASSAHRCQPIMAAVEVHRSLSRKVDTTGLIKLTVLTEADCSAMREAFRRCWMLLYSQPGELDPRVTALRPYNPRFDSLTGWTTDIRSRQDKTIYRNTTGALRTSAPALGAPKNRQLL